MSRTDEARASLAAVAALLAPAHEAVAARALHAHDDPAGYVRDHGAALANRGIDEPVPGLAWTALVDALAEHRLLAELDWKEDTEEIRSQLRGLVSQPSVDPWVLVGADDMLLPTHEFLEACGRHFLGVGAALAILDIESDCYPVVCLRAARVAELTLLAARAGFTAHGFGA